MIYGFEEFPKIARLSRGTFVTEKIDGTNAQVFIVPLADNPTISGESVYVGNGVQIWAGSRNRWITPAADNFGFAEWVVEHAAELVDLGPGRHFGEWWGRGIQRGYDVPDKRFSLFNVGRWRETPPPECCGVVPVLYEGDFDMAAITSCLDRLRDGGSVASPGFMRPEGVVVYHAASRTYFKKTLERDEEPKGMRR